MKVTKEITFDMGHRLSNYSGKCFNLHGHTYKLQVQVEGDIGEDGFVIDFTELKEVLKKVTDLFDHKTVLYAVDDVNIKLEQVFPCSIKLIDYEPTAENLAFYFKKTIQDELPKYKVSKIRLWETPTSYAEC